MTLPPGWTATTLGRLGRYVNGRGFKKSEWGTTGRPIIRIQNLTGTSQEFNYFDGEVEDRHVARPGDVLVSWAATLGAYVWRGPEALVNQHIFRVDSNIDPNFHKYLLDYKLSELMQHTHGSGMVHITKSRFEEVPVALPPLDEQGRIVAVLEASLSRLDALETSLKSAGLRAERLLDSAIRARSRRAANSAPFSSAVEVVSNGDRVLAQRDYQQAGRWPVVDQGLEAVGGRTDRDDLVFTGPLPVIVFGDHTRRLKIVEEPFVQGAQGTKLLRPRSGWDCRYVYWMLRGQELPGRGYGRHFALLRASSLPARSVDDQLRVVTELEDAAAVVRTLKTSLRIVQLRLMRLRRSVLSAAVEGRLLQPGGTERTTIPYA